MIAFGPGSKPGNITGWYVRIWPNPGAAIPLSGGRRAFIRLQADKQRGRRFGIVRPRR